MLLDSMLLKEREKPRISALGLKRWKNQGALYCDVEGIIFACIVMMLVVVAVVCGCVCRVTETDSA